MGNGIQINRVAERFSSHTKMRSYAREESASAGGKAVREKLIAALAEVVAEGGDPRLM
jgi:hypothetical protein